ncbi:MAG: transcriptional repressor LexA [Candidatus Promineifilaceae bacterium]|nr:transcriptional repressor LexA [Candidatus Promineifilaceae bacterium]
MSDEIKLSPRQERIVHYIHDSIEDESRPPTIREIGGALKISSTSVVNYNLNRLKEKGLIERDRTVSRGLRLTDAAYEMLGLSSSTAASVKTHIQNLVRIPILGNIVAGEPIDVSNESFAVYDEEDMVEMSSTMLPGRKDELFALRVDGYSMVDDMISDGDIVILRHQETAQDGDVVAAWVEGEGTTLKRFYREQEVGKVRLQPRNPNMDPIYADPEDVKIQGKLVLTLSQEN